MKKWENSSIAVNNKTIISILKGFMECVILYGEPDQQIVQALSASVRKSISNLSIYHLIS